MLTGQTGLGFNPLHAVAKVARTAGRGIATGAKATGHVAAKGAKLTVRAALLPYEFGLKLTEAATRLALRPVTSRVHTLTNRRANKIAWDKRKSKTPTPAERNEAKAWTKAQLKKKLPHGPLLAMLAGPLPMPAYNLGSMNTNLGVAPAVIAALVPVFIELLNVMLRSFAKSGEAPVSIGPNGQVMVPPGMDPTMPDPGVSAEPGPPDPDAVAAAGGDDGGGGGGGAMVPGEGSGRPNANVLKVGAVVVGVVVLAMLFKKKS